MKNSERIEAPEMKRHIKLIKTYLKPLKEDQRKNFTQKNCKRLKVMRKNMKCSERDTWKAHHKILNSAN